MIGRTLCLFADALPARARLALDAVPRVLYVLSGEARVEGAGASAGLSPDAAFAGADRLELVSSAKGARLLRWELRATAPESAPLLAAPVAFEDGARLLRCDSVSFPPGGVAYTHTHQGPGIRCLVEGSISVEAGGHKRAYGPGGAWFESGPEPVYAAASTTLPTVFVRVMVLPRALLGKSSIRYVRPEDADQPKPQAYRIYIDRPLDIA